MLIDETNWKQELAKLKARRVVLQQEYNELERLWLLGDKSEPLVNRAGEIHSEIDDVLDNAIETIENVFVYKRCYI
jgi:hypothetical protein